MANYVDCSDLALKNVEIKGDVIGKFGYFEVEQTYKNNLDEVLEVYYTFPISETATVVGFEVDINGQIIVGKCKEKSAAKKEYQQNIVQGNSAYLMEQEADNIFKIAVGKLDIDEEVKIKIRFIDNFEIIDNAIEVFIPMLVKPKYKSEVTDKLTYGKVDYRANLIIEIPKSLLNIEKISSSTHHIDLYFEEENHIVAVDDFNLTKDFKMLIKLKEELSSNAVIRYASDGDLLYLSFMPEILDSYEDSEKDYIFLIDISGSMQGENLDETKRAVIECLKQLDEGDTFNIIAFDDEFEAMNFRSIAFNEENLKKAIDYVEDLCARGGTEIFQPLKYILDQKESEKIILLFTDGQVGNEEKIINYVRRNIAKSRLFPFGIDTAVNSSFIKSLAKVGHGKAELIMPGEKIGNKIIRTFARIQTPLLENLQIDYGSAKLIDEIRESDTLFNFEFFNVLAKVDCADDVTLKGKVNGQEYSWKIKRDDICLGGEYLEQMLAKEQIRRIEEYINNANYGDNETIKNYEEMIVDIAVKNNINSNYTSFISVYERENKIVEIPQCQITTLDDDMFDCVELSVHSFSSLKPSFYGCNSLDIPEFINPKERSSLKLNEVEKTSTEILEELVDDYVVNDDSILVNILYPLYCVKKGKKYDLDMYIEFIKDNFEKIQKYDLAFKLLIMLYRATKSKRIYLLFSLQDRAIIDSGVKFKIDIPIVSDDFVKEWLKEEKLIAEYLYGAIWYLYNS